MKNRPLAALLVLSVLILGLGPSETVIAPVNAQVAIKREVTIPVKVVFVGIDPALVNIDYMKWNFSLPTTTYEQVLSPQPYLTGVVYTIDYNFAFASDAFKARLVSFLESIEISREGPNPWFYYYVAEPSGYVSSGNFYSFKYVAYDANQVEDWLYKNQQDVGGFPSDGWTLMFLNLPELPSYDFEYYKDFLSENRNDQPSGTGHYYSVQYRDSDLDYQLRFRDFMTGWGGVHRFSFHDLSAGPSFWSPWEDLPLQIVLKDNRIDLQTSFGRTWFTEYLSDYIFQATWNLITPFYVYTPTYSEKYTFDIHVFDNRTAQERAEVNIRSTINPNKIKAAFEDLLPYSEIEVSVQFEDLSKYPDLVGVIGSNYKFTDSYTFGTVFAEPLQYGIIDARPVYKYLQENIKVFEQNFHRDRSEFTVPIFAFAFSEDTLFTFTYKWVIQHQDPENSSLLGVALGDLALVSLSQRQFQRGYYVSPVQPKKGYGFTQTVIHEAGHMIGLAHPHQFGDIGDFTVSAMGYYTWDYVFGQSDKDAIRRAHVNQIYVEVQSLLEQLKEGGTSNDVVDLIGSQLREVDAKYSQMNYVEALRAVLRADNTARSALSGLVLVPGGSMVQPSIAYAMYVTVGVAVGLIVGFAVAWLILKRRTQVQTAPL